MVNDEGGAVLRENIFKEPVEEYIPVHLLHRFTIIPWRGPDKTVIRPLISPVNPVRNSSGALNPAGIILKSNPAAEHRGIISNGVKEVASEPIFEAAQRFNTLHDICEGDPFAKILKQPVGE
ncbi:MAG: hypothetical protein Q8P64_19710 [Deltaproteobacteria bacterium]|nr:hypothetical protein [Deltaproteobacteria bacterium]